MIGKANHQFQTMTFVEHQIHTYLCTLLNLILANFVKQQQIFEEETVNVNCSICWSTFLVILKMNYLHLTLKYLIRSFLSKYLLFVIIPKFVVDCLVVTVFKQRSVYIWVHWGGEDQVNARSMTTRPYWDAMLSSFLVIFRKLALWT